MKLKKLFAGLISIAAGLLAVGAISVCAGAEELTSGYWQYEVQSDNTVYVTGYTGFTDKLTIPSKIAGKTVSGIGEAAFQDSDSFTSVVIPSTVKTIGYKAFSGSSIKSVTIPSTITSWQTNWNGYSYAFSDCADLTSVTVNSAMLESYAFYNCDNLTTATVNSETVEYAAFRDCASLSNVTLGAKVKYLESDVFLDNAALSKVTIKGSLLKIGESCFENCSSLTSFTLGSKLTDLGCYAFKNTGLKSITLPSSIKTWLTNWNGYSYAFSDCVDLKSVTVNSPEIGAYAFYNCDNLTTATINAENIQYSAFSDCASLSNVTLGAKVRYLESNVFLDDKALSKLTVNGDLLEIGNCCFENCSSLTSINLGKRLYSLGYQAFDGSGLKTITIPSTVTTWQTNWNGYNYALRNCVDLTSVYFGYGTMPDAKYLFDGSNNVHMYCFPGSDALAYAKENNIPYSLRTAVPATSIKLNKTSAILEVGEELVLDATVSPSNSNDGVTWTSGDDDVAECRSGIIYARSEGIAAIRAKTTSGKIAVCNVTVINKKPVDVAAIALSSRGSSTLTIKWTPTDTADGYIVEKYVGGKWTRAAKISSKATSAYTVNGLKPSTKYSIRVRSYKMVGSTAVYSAYKSGSWTTNPSAVSGLKLKGRSSDALRLSWTKNTSADGYIIERKDGSKWVRVVKITKNSTTEYRIAKLKAGTTYNFRIRTYNMVGSTPLYSGYKTISACTKPSNISGLRLKAAVSNAVRLAWSKNTSADGYIIEMKSGSKWVRVGKITKNSTVEFRKSGLKSKTSYTFRVQAYKMSGKTALYGATKTITVKTK